MGELELSRGVGSEMGSSKWERGVGSESGELEVRKWKAESESERLDLKLTNLTWCLEGEQMKISLVMYKHLIYCYESEVNIWFLQLLINFFITNLLLWKLL